MIFIFLRLLKLLAITLLFLVGLAGIVLPILNGTLFLLLALILVSSESPYVKKKLHELTDKNDTAHRWHLYLEILVKKVFRTK
jgi:uncharacterized membrane protein YbaN (DUF454 family)